MQGVLWQGNEPRTLLGGEGGGSVGEGQGYGTDLLLQGLQHTRSKKFLG